MANSVRSTAFPETPSAFQDTAPLAVLISGGLDSAILLGETRLQRTVHPLYMRSGLAWEAVELRHLRHFLELVHVPALQPLHILELPVADLYGNHWSVSGRNVPDAASPDEAMFLPGRNVLLLAKAVLWCHLHEVSIVALGLLRGNPFPDATPDFFAALQQVLNQALGGEVRIDRPYAMLSKAEVMKRGQELPLEWTFSCIRPVDGKHCGQCNKCAERRRAFAAAALPDRTAYAWEGPCTA
jgi:7-cyano-7-deazaguanine synthase